MCLPLAVTDIWGCGQPLGHEMACEPCYPSKLLTLRVGLLLHMQAVCGGLQLPYQGQVLDFEAPFRRATMHELVKDVSGVDFEACATDIEVCWGS
jgi:hypothetical protein